MILVDFFSHRSCLGTELVEGWYWYEDDGEGVGGPFDEEEDAIIASKTGKVSKYNQDYTFNY